MVNDLSAIWRLGPGLKSAFGSKSMAIVPQCMKGWYCALYMMAKWDEVKGSEEEAATRLKSIFSLSGVCIQKASFTFVRTTRVPHVSSEEAVRALAYLKT